MYLSEALGEHPAAGVIKGASFDSGKLCRFGYLKLRAKNDGLLFKTGQELPAHEFHYWDTENPGSDFEAIKSSGRSYECAYNGKSLYAGFPYLHFYSDLSLAESFCRACAEEKKHD